MASTWPELHAGTTFSYVWDTGTLAWVKAAQAGGGTGGAGDASAANQTTEISYLTQISAFSSASEALLEASIITAGRTTEPTMRMAVAGQSVDNHQHAIPLGDSGRSVILEGYAGGVAVPVSGTFFQGTQPVSIASMPSTPVTGTFFQGTQPVSGPLTDTQLRASAVPVSLPAATVTTLTPPAAITGFGLEATQLLQATAANQVTETALVTTIAAATHLEDSASADADRGMALLGVRLDDPVPTTSASGDYMFLATDSQGRLWVNNTSTAPQPDRVANALRAQLVAYAAAQPMNGFVPMEIPSFLTGL